MNPLQLAWLNLWRKKYTTLLALISLALPVALAGNLHRLQILANERFNQLDTEPGIIIGAKAGEIDILLNSLHLEGELPDFFTENLYNSINARYLSTLPPEQREPPYEDILEHSFPILFFAKYNQARVIGTNKFFWERPAFISTPQLTSGRTPNALREVVIGSELADHLKLGDEIKLSPWIHQDQEINDRQSPVFVKVVGIMAPTGKAWDKAVYATLEQAKHTLSAAHSENILHPSWRENVLHFIVAYDAPLGFNEISRLVNHATIAQAISVPQQVNKLHQLTGTRQKLGYLVAVLTLFLGVFAIIGIMMTRFDFMRSQLNVLRAIGYRKRDLALWLISEGLFLGLAAILLGTGLDILLFPKTVTFAGLDSVLSPSTQVSIFKNYPVWIGILTASMAAAGFPLIKLFSRSVHSESRSF